MNIDFILQTIDKAITNKKTSDYDSHDNFIKVIYSIGSHDKSDIVIYESDKDHFKMYIHIYNYQIMLDKNDELYSNKWYHPAPHDYEQGHYKVTTFKNVEELIEYVKKK